MNLRKPLFDLDPGLSLTHFVVVFAITDLADYQYFVALAQIQKLACLPQTTTRCHSVRVSHSSAFGFFHEVDVATDSTAKLLPLPLSFRSGSAPRNPINCALFVSITFKSPFVSPYGSACVEPEPQSRTSLVWLASPRTSPGGGWKGAGERLSWPDVARPECLAC